MCWSGEASLAVATLGVTGSLVARKKGAPTARWATLLYFTGMELLQAATYVVIDRCGIPSNIGLTRLSYIHIALQPFFINLLAMSFIPDEEAKRLRRPVFLACTIGALIMIAKMYVPNAAMACNAATVPVCGTDTCSYHGNWHIAWRLYLSSVDNSYLAYYLPAFFVPLFYGAWRWCLYHLMVGPVVAAFLTTNKDERPAIWCLMSIFFLLALHLKPLEHWLETPRRSGRPSFLGGWGSRLVDWRVRLVPALVATAWLAAMFSVLRAYLGSPAPDVLFGFASAGLAAFLAVTLRTLAGTRRVS